MFAKMMKSKTILGIFIAMLVQLAPQLGFSFGAEDGVLISTAFDSIITAASGVFAVYGRVVAKGPLG